MSEASINMSRNFFKSQLDFYICYIKLLKIKLVVRSISRKVILIIFCLLSLSKARAQITPTSNIVNACAPATITFTAPAGATNINWTFGNFPPSNAASGGFAVVTPITFTATFSGLVNGSPQSFSVQVIVNPRPSANFNIIQPANDCAVKTVSLVNTSTASAALSNWTWVYGDGGIATFSNGNTHTYGYVAPGSYSVTLQVTDINGCDDQKTVGTINVINSPTAVISSNPPVLVGCQSNFSAVFSASNSIGNNLSYNWSFGNGQSGNQVNSTAQTYTSQVLQYPVSLTVTSQGCTNVTSTFVTVSPATLSVTISPTICVGVPFTATVLSNQPYSAWNSVAGSFALATPAVSNPTLSISGFAAPGLYTINISAGTSPCIAPPLTRTVLVEQVLADFNGSTPTVSCSSPFAVTYSQNCSPNASSYTWTILNTNSVTNTYTGATAAHVFSGGSNNAFAVFVRPYTPTVTLLAMSPNGCMAAVTKTVHSIERPAAWYNVSKKEGCIPLAVTLYDSSIVYPSCPIISYTWNNGATPPTLVSGTLGLPPAANTRIPWQTFTYTTAGVYYPYLSITTASNYTNTTNTCSDISYVTTITAVSPPTVSFNVPTGPYCPNQPVQINNTSPSLSSIQHWHVESDNGFFSGCVNDPNPSWKFTNTGVFNFTLTGYQNSCAASAVSGPVTIKGPIAEAYYETNCNGNRSSVNFSVELQEVATATLQFGDGFQTVFAGNPLQVINSATTHVYTSSGNYTATLMAENPATNCSASVYTFVVTVRNAQANIISNPTVCLGNSIGFNAGNSVDVQVGCQRGYLWFIDDWPPVETTSPAFSTVIPVAGIHTVVLRVKDDNSCTSEFTTTVRVSSVTAAFSLNSNTVCSSNPTVQITNQTIQVPDPITSYNWNFGDGNVFSSSNATVPIHSYLNVNSPSSFFNISVTATNSLGCTGSAFRTITVLKPYAAFSPSSDYFCVKTGTTTNVSFVPQYAYSTYTINYGASANSTAVTNGSASYNYSLAGVYSVSFEVQTAAGCKNTGSLQITGVQTPTADFGFSSPNSTGGNNICAGPSGVIVTFTNTSQPFQYSPIWNLGSGVLASTSNTVSLSYSTPTSTVIAVTLTVNTGSPAFCVNSISKNFTVSAYQADFISSNSVVCNGKPLNFSLTPASFGLGAWVWSFGDAVSSPTLFANSSPPPTASISHVYSNYTATAAGMTTVSLIYYSSNLACRESKQHVIKVEKVFPGFLRNQEMVKTDSAHCLRILDTFSNTSLVNSNLLTYQWRLGDGGFSSATDISYIYPKAGVYEVTLIATNENGCMDSVSKRMEIYPLPFAKILALEEGYCPNQLFDLSLEAGDAVISGTWTPANAFSSPQFTMSGNTHTSVASASSNTVFGLSVTSDKHCVSDPVDTTITIVQPPLPVVWDTAVVVGQKIPISVLLDRDVTYTWTPIVADLSCLSCLNPISSSTDNIVYTLVMEDKLKCSQVKSTYSITILPYTSVDVPTAFTPNGDGINDVIYADGWGIKKLNYFRIFNRWGQLLFESTDIKIGWDGTWQGKAQNMDSYIYQVSVETYIDAEPLIKSSTFKLIR